MNEIEELLDQLDNTFSSSPALDVREEEVSKKEKEAEEIIEYTSQQKEETNKKVHLKFSSETEEKMIVGYFYQDRATFLKLAQYLTTKNWQKDSFFNDRKLQFLMNTCYEYSNKYKKMPTEDIVFSEIEKKVDDIFTQEKIKKLFSELQTIDYTAYSDEYIKDAAVEFIRNERAIEAAEICQKEISKGNYSNLSKIMSDAVNVNLDKDLGISVKNIAQTFSLVKEVKNPLAGCTWGSPTLDSILGRIQKGEIGILAGVPGAGKTTWLQHFAVDNFTEHKKVALFSFEVSEQRLLGRVYKNILDVDTQQLLDYDEQDAFKILDASKGDIRIFARPANSMSANDMAAVLTDLKTYENWVPDLILVDYVAITSANDKKKDSTETYKYYKTVTEELRNLAVEMNCPVISAVQLNREAMGDTGGSKATVSSKNIAESRGVLDTADYVLMIEQTAEEKYTNKEHSKGVYRLRTDKNRNGGSNETVWFEIDWSRMMIIEIDASKGKKLQEAGKQLLKEETKK